MKLNICRCESLGCISIYLWRQALATITSSLISLSCGLVLGMSAVVLPQLREDTELQYDSSDDSWVASIVTLSMIIGGVSVGKILDKYGRRKSHIIWNIPFIIGWSCIAFANSTTLILVGRFITGLAAGSNKPLSLVYIGEISDPKFRSATLFVPGLMTQAGILLSHLVGSYVAWRTTAILCIASSVLCTIATMFLKESPLWLISKGKIEEGMETFQWFRGTNVESENELTAVLDKNKTDDSFKDILNILFSKSFLKPFILLIIVMINLQISGANVITFYMKDVLDLTFVGQIDSVMLMLVTDLLKGIVGVIICLIGTMISRKKAHITVCFGVILNLGVLCAYLIVKLEGYIWIPLLTLITYIACSAAVVSIAWTFIPELLPTKVRGLGSGLTTGISYIILFIAVKITPNIMAVYGIAALYGIFAITTVICVTILIFCLPETNGKTLQSIEDSIKENK